MFRKLIIVAGATAAIATASVAAPTAASAGWHGHHHKHHKHWSGWRGPAFGYYAPVYYGSSCYVVKKRVYTDYGPRIRRVTVCG
jgi:hypothetical protein